MFVVPLEPIAFGEPTEEGGLLLDRQRLDRVLNLGEFHVGTLPRLAVSQLEGEFSCAAAPFCYSQSLNRSFADSMQMIQTLFPEGPRDSSCVCTRCGTRLPSDDINIAADTALCRKCGVAYRFSELLESAAYGGLDLTNPPEGVSFRSTAGGFVCEATTRSWYGWFLVPFMLVWSGFSLGGLYGTQFRNGRFDLGSSLFGIPFIIGSLFLGAQAVMSIGGVVAIERDGDAGSVFQGVGPIGWTRRFRWTELISVMETTASSGPRGGHRYRVIRLILNGGRRRSLNFGTLLSDDRRWFLLSVVRSQISTPGSRGW